MKTKIIFFFNKWHEVKKIVQRWLREKNIPNESEVYTEIRVMEQKTKHGQELVNEYYRIAPEIANNLKPII